MPGSRIGLNSLVGDIKDAVNFTSTRTRGKLPQTGVGGKEAPDPTPGSF